MSKIVSTAIHWVDLHSDSLVILLGGLTGALWQTKLIQVIHDICTLQNIEGAIIVAIKAFIGAVVAWVVKTVCNYFKYKRKKTDTMGKITVSKNNIGKPAPRGFRKVKNVLTIIFDASIMIAFFYGFTENSKEILVARIAYSAIMNSLEQLLANGEVYAPSETALGKK